MHFFHQPLSFFACLINYPYLSWYLIRKVKGASFICSLLEFYLFYICPSKLQSISSERFQGAQCEPLVRGEVLGEGVMLYPQHTAVLATPYSSEPSQPLPVSSTLIFIIYGLSTAKNCLDFLHLPIFCYYHESQIICY